MLIASILEIVVDLFLRLRLPVHQYPDATDGVGNRNQNTEVIAFAAQQIIIDVLLFTRFEFAGLITPTIANVAQTVIFFHLGRSSPPRTDDPQPRRCHGPPRLKESRQ